MQEVTLQITCRSLAVTDDRLLTLALGPAPALEGSPFNRQYALFTDWLAGDLEVDIRYSCEGEEGLY